MVSSPLLPILTSMLALAAESGGPPRVDIQMSCRAAERDLTKLFGSGSMVTFETCLNQENTAFSRIAKDWPTYPPADKAHCIQANSYMPSDVEWLIYLEIERDLRGIRANEKSERVPLARTR